MYHRATLLVPPQPGQLTHVLHVIDPQSPGCGPCTLRLLADLTVRLDSVRNTVVIIGTARDVAIARACGLNPSGHFCPASVLPLSGIRQLRTLIDGMAARSTPVDLIHAWSVHCAALATIAAQRIRRIVTLNAAPPRTLHSRVYARTLSRRATPILAASPAIIRECRALGFARQSLALFPPAIYCDLNSMPARVEVRRRWAGESRVNHAAFVVGLMTDPISLPDARAAATTAGRLVLAGRDVRLVLHPQVSRRVEAERFLKHLAMDSMVVQDDAMECPWQVLPGLDAVLVPRGMRDAQTTLLPLLWSMAAGTPVVADSTESARQIIDDGVNGLLFDADNVNAASDRIARVHDHRELANSLIEAAKATVTDLYNIDSYAQRLSHSYALLLAHPEAKAAQDAKVNQAQTQRIAVV